MKTFEYELIVENARGRQRRTVRRAAFARPLVSEEIVIKDVVYVVRRVQHQEDDSRTVQVYIWQRLFVRAKRKA